MVMVASCLFHVPFNQVPTCSSNPAASTSGLSGSGRCLPFIFIKGGAETSRLMNLINLGIEGSGVARKMLKDVNAQAKAKAQTKPAKASDVALSIKKELTQVKSLNIELKPGEMQKLNLTNTDASSASAGTNNDAKARAELQIETT